MTSLLLTEGWAGLQRQLMAIVGGTKHRHKIRAITLTRLPGRLRSLKPGLTALVPKYAVIELKEDPS